MNKLVTNLSVVLAAAAFIVAGIAMLGSRPEIASGSVYDAARIGSATTSAAFSVTTSARILATTTSLTGTSYSRIYAIICNPNANPVFLNLDNDKGARTSTGNITVAIAAAAGYDVCYEITDRNLYMGSITASSTAETATVIYVKDYVQ